MRRAIHPRGLLAALVLALSLGSAHWLPVQAAPPANSIIHIVQPGESLYLIAQQYGVSGPAIIEANHLPSTTIFAGQALIIPDGQAVSTATPAGPAATAEPTTSAPAATTYVVQRGDSLSAIARQFRLTASDLVAANATSNPSLIFAGQVLVIPTGSAAAGAAPVPTDAAPVPGREPGPDKVIVVSISEQRMTVYQDGGIRYEWVVSTGEPGLDTWPGQYAVLDKIPNAYGANWDLWMPNWLGIYWAGNLENGIHALPILPDGLRLWDGYLGSKVSFGCVILGITEAQTLYDWASVGTPVNIQQ
jgi:LysM repeat protein